MTELETYVEVELSPWGHISDPGLLTWKSAHGSIGESFTDGTTHNAQPLDVFSHLGECRKQQCDVSQGTRCNYPGSTLGLCKKSISHGQNGILIGDGCSSGLGK
jgi:hypothetical protein